MTSHIKKRLEKAKASGFAPADMLIDKFNGGDTEVSLALTGTNQSRKRPLHKENTARENGVLLTSEYIFPHKSENEALKILRRYGTVEDVPGDGNCGYHAIMLLLRQMKLINNTLSVSQFRREIHDFVVTNMNKFVGASPDGNDAIFQYPWGLMSRLKKRGCNPETSRTRFMTTKVMSGIWRKHVDYSTSVGRAHWMDSTYLLPIIVYKYKMRKVVLYDNSGTDTESIDGGRCFTTCVYCYNESKSSVSTDTKPGLVHDIGGASGNACIVFFREQQHFMLFKYFDPCS